MKQKTISSIKYQLISLIEMGDLKLDYDTLEKTMLGKYGNGTLVFENFNFFDWNYKFSERKENDKYSLNAAISMYPKKYYYVIGQSGLFLKIDENTSYAEISNIIAESKRIIDFCKLFLTKPFGVVHFSDGDYYITNASACRHYKSCFNPNREITEIFKFEKE